MPTSILRLAFALSLPACAPLIAQETVSTGPAYADEVYYDLETGTSVAYPLNSWDIGFQINGFAASIITNGGGGVRLYNVPDKDVAAFGSPLDTTGMSAAWTSWNNSIETWDIGAFTMDADYESGDFGWGTYSMVTHTVSGATLYVIVLPDGSARQMVIDALASGVYNFRYADIDGSNQKTATAAKKDAAGKNFLYYSIRNGAQIDREPLAADWDLLFGNYIDFAGPNLDIPYGVTGVRSNVGVAVAEITSATPQSEPEPSDESYSEKIATIGYDWKQFSGGAYVVSSDLVYFVKSREGRIFRLIFTGFGGSANGNFVFTKQALSSSSVDDAGTTLAGMTIYPNVIDRKSRFECVYTIERPVGTARLTIVDITGRTLLNRLLAGKPGLHVESVRLDAPAGIYMAILNVDGRQTHQRLIIR